MLRSNKGFTLIELCIVVVIIGIIAVIAIPSYNDMQDAAKEGSVRANMHTLQLSLEDFAVENGGTYPVSSKDMKRVRALCPGGVWPTNPFTKRESSVNVNFSYHGRGSIGITFPKKGQQYLIVAAGRKANSLLPLQLKNY